MRRALAAFVGLVFFTAGVFAVFRILQRDYRYHELVRTGDDLLAQQLSVEASRTYGTAIDLKPEEPLAYVKRADAERRQGNLARALEDMETAGRLSADALLLSSRLADILYDSGRFDEAARHFETVVALAPESTACALSARAHPFSGRARGRGDRSSERRRRLETGFLGSLLPSGSGIPFDRRRRRGGERLQRPRSSSRPTPYSPRRR